MVLAAIAAIPAAALTEEEVQEQVESVGRERVTGNVFIWFLCAIGFLKVAQKMDDCIPVFESARYDADVNRRLQAVNWLLVRLWPYIRETVEYTRQEMAAKRSLEKILERRSKSCQNFFWNGRRRLQSACLQATIC